MCDRWGLTLEDQGEADCLKPFMGLASTAGSHAGNARDEDDEEEVEGVEGSSSA